MPGVINLESDFFGSHGKLKKQSLCPSWSITIEGQKYIAKLQKMGDHCRQLHGLIQTDIYEFNKTCKWNNLFEYRVVQELLSQTLQLFISGKKRMVCTLLK
ncbi:Hypothetical protein CINCED_3A001596 [Cinara cedri]|uniref:Uncharacterized protein n=1 Tax=Cinara cedri TaxID=506608 RepID=A0A5E4NEQ8_9HEMI|nr:Hypothetical protein CINCED_3A001596 [Cinara cedri]